MFFTGRPKRIYLDYAAATPVRREVLDAMKPYWNEQYGNASAIHKEGVAAHSAVEHSRESLARVLHIRPQGVVFTGSGTESNNLAIFGIIEQKRREGIAYQDMEIIATPIEHASVLEALGHAQELGVQVLFVDVDEEGIIKTQHFQTLLTPRTIFCTCAYVNSEIGVIQPLGKLSRIVRSCEQQFGTRIIFHTDASQAPLWLSCALDTLSVDMLTLDAGKCYGPKGVGVLAYKHGVQIAPYLFGGSQEQGLRPGTENTPLIAGTVCALKIAQQHFQERSEKVSAMRDQFIAQLCMVPGVLLNGSNHERVANNINISIPGLDSEFAAVCLDEAGIACSTKSACGGAKGDGSSVVRTLSGDDARARATLRFTLGEETTAADIAYTVLKLREHMARMQTYIS